MDIELSDERDSFLMVAKGANGSKGLEGPDMGVSGVDGPGFSGSGVVAVDEGGDFLGPLVKKALSVLKPEALDCWEQCALISGRLKLKPGSIPECSVKSSEKDFGMS